MGRNGFRELCHGLFKYPHRVPAHHADGELGYTLNGRNLEKEWKLGAEQDQGRRAGAEVRGKEEAEPPEDN